MGESQVKRMLIVTTVVITMAVIPMTAMAQVGPGYDISISRMIPMRDGVKLEAWIFEPSDLKDIAPTVL